MAHVDKIRGQERWSREWGLRALAAAQRVQLGLSAFADTMYGLVQPHAASFKWVPVSMSEAVSAQDKFALQLAAVDVRLHRSGASCYPQKRRTYAALKRHVGLSPNVRHCPT